MTSKKVLVRLMNTAERPEEDVESLNEFGGFNDGDGVEVLEHNGRYFISVPFANQYHQAGDESELRAGEFEVIEWPIEKMLWVLTYQIGTNENRRSRTINFASLEMAESAQEVLGGSIEEYIATSLVRHASEADDFNHPYLCKFDGEGDMEALRKRHAAWSDRQFVIERGPVGPLRHLALEAIEAAEQPDDISEFADLIMLKWDVLRRSGFTRPMLCEAVRAKLEVNERRDWDVRDQICRAFT